jgi:hypothetical protein
MSIISDLPKGAEVLDLGAARAARAEARAADGQGSLFLKLSAGYVEVHPEIPLEAAFSFKAEDIRGGLTMLLVDPSDVDALLADGLTAQDLEQIILFASGKSLGE